MIPSPDSPAKMTSTNAIQTLTKDGQKRVEYRDQQGNLLFSHEGGDRTWRNNNPGNLRNAVKGSIGTDSESFAIFPDLETGLKAKYDLLRTDKRYDGLTISEAIHKYAPKIDNNNPEEYLKNIKDWTGIDRNKKLTDLTEEEYKHLMYSIARQEGFIDKYGNQKAKGVGTRIDHRSPEEQAKNPLPSIHIESPPRVLKKSSGVDVDMGTEKENNSPDSEYAPVQPESSLPNGVDPGQYLNNPDQVGEVEFGVQPVSFGFLGEDDESTIQEAEKLSE
jgi:hypothetical protein